MNKIIQESYSTLEDLLGYYYDFPHDFNDIEFWKSIAKVSIISEESAIPSLYTSQILIFRIFKFLTALPYKRNSYKILKFATQYMDPAPHFLKKIISQLIPCIENQIPCLSTLNVTLSLYNLFFQQQRPANQNIDSHIYLYGSEEGIQVKQSIKWPFERGGTLSFWYNMSDLTKQCKIFQFMTQEKVGFQIIMKNKKVYIQKQDDQSKFRLIKNTSAYLCDAIFNKNVKLCIEFEIKKKFFQPYLSINLIMNNFVLNGVEIDSFPINNNTFKISFFKHFYGKFYSLLLLSEKLAGQIDQLNNQKGFIFENDIRNFSYLFEKNNQKIIMLYSAIRAKTIKEQKARFQQQNQFQDELKEIMHAQIKPIRTYLFDVIGTRIAEIGSKACCYTNSSIGKQIGNYGGFQSILPFIDLLQISCCSDQLYGTALNQFLQLIKSIFQNKSDSIQKAYNLNFFKIFSAFLNQTKMEGFSYDTITRLKQIYIALNTRMLRQKYIQQIVWGINFGLYLNGQNFNNYIKFVKTFYNEDIQSSLHAFDLTKILFYVIQNLDTLECCVDHVGVKISSNSRKQKKYSKVLQGIFQVVENILMIKRSEADLDQMIKQLIQVFAYTISPCLISALLQFLSNLFIKDTLLQHNFCNYIQKQNPESKFSLYKCLSSCNSWKIKAKLTDFILKILYPNFFDENKREKQILALCAKYSIMNHIRSSSVKSRQGRDSIEYSQEKLSLNSTSMHKLMVINPIESKNQILVNEGDVVDVITKWTFSETVLQQVSEQHQNPGLLILMELYKASTYKIRLQISKTICSNMKIIRFGPELMAWAIQCSLIAQYDLKQIQKSESQIQLTKQSLIQIICNYDFYDVDDQQNNQLMIIKLVFSSVKAKYPDQIVKTVGNKLFFIICERKMHIFVQKLKNHDHADLQSYDKLCWRVISNVFTYMNQYYVIKGDDDQIEFDEQMAGIVQSQNYIIIQIMEKILQIFVLATSINDLKIIQEGNADRNHEVINIIFLQKQKQKQKINIIYEIIFSLQTIFDFFEDVQIEPKKKCLSLIKKYVIYVIQLTQNSGNAKLQQFQEDLRNILLLSLSFYEQKYYQYFYYPYEKHKNLDFQLENKIRKSIEQMKKTIFNIFLDLIQVIQYIDQKGNLQHKSFYEIMKPKRKHTHKYPLKHIYPNFWKKADEKIIQFICLKKQILRKDAHQKLESYILLKKISAFCVNAEKAIAKKLFNYVQTQRKESDARQRKSVNFYKISESQKCKKFSDCEQQLTQFRIKMLQEEKLYLNKQKQLKDVQKRQLKNIKNKLWNQNRCFEGFWANKQFYQFSQTQLYSADNNLRKFYARKRSQRQSKYFLLPFIRIEALLIHKNDCKQEPVYIRLNQRNSQIAHNQKTNKRRTSQKLINGLQFIKKKVYDKIAKTIAMGSEKLISQINTLQSQRILIQDVLWIKPMIVYAGFLKIQAGKLAFCHKSSKKFEHVSLLKNVLHDSDILVKQWKLFDIEGLILKRFLLKQNSIQLYFKNRKSLLLHFYSASEDQFTDIVAKILKIINLSQICDQALLKIYDPLRMWDKLQLTQKWLNYQISNFDYLMCLNIASGRTNCDLNQYPVFPWIFSQYKQTKVKKHGDKYRDFNKNMALLGNEERIKKFQQTYDNINQNHNDQFLVPHYFGFHYSNMGIVLQYLIRLNPYSYGSKHLQGGKFDISDRLFHSIPQSFKSATQQVSDLRQLIPQFFYFPEFLINYQQFDFGKLQNGNKKVNHVQLPDGCMNAFDFIQHHRQGLQSKEVSVNLHKWIDLIFGYKSSGKQADKSMNTYHYLTNQVNIDKIQSVEDPIQKQALQSQMAYYGKTPSQLFYKPHPQRQSRQTFSFDEWQKKSYSFHENMGQFFQRENMKVVSQILCLSYSCKDKKYTLINKKGKGLVFNFQKFQFNKLFEFKVEYKKFEGINIQISDQDNFNSVAIIDSESIVFGGFWAGKLLIFNIYLQSYDLIQKHTTPISDLVYTEEYNLLFSGSTNGQLCKWIYKQKKLHFVQKIHTYQTINNIRVDSDLKIVAVGTNDGILWLISIENMELIRTIKVNYPIIKFTILKTPFYHIMISCKGFHQYCYSLNAAKLQESQMQKVGELSTFCFSNFQQKVIMEMGSDLVFMKTPEFSIQEKLEVGIGQSGFKFVTNQKQILLINESQILVWRHPNFQKTTRKKSV